MEKYSINHTIAVKKDITDIAYYICECLKNPSAADEFLQFIEYEIDQLEVFPFKYNGIGYRYDDKEIRMKPANEYNIFYVIDKKRKEITVLRILNRRKEWDWIMRRL